MKISPETYEILFKENYEFLCLVSFQILKDEDFSKDIVQEFFEYLWKNKSKIIITTTFKSYAYKAVRNLSLQHLKKIKKNISLEEHPSIDNLKTQDNTEENEHIKYQSELFQLINQMPESRKAIFMAYVVEGLSYKQIAESKDISINTVKTQMKRAYAYLKENASDVYPALVLLAFLK